MKEVVKNDDEDRSILKITVDIPGHIEETGTIILKFTFETILREETYYTNHLRLLRFLEDVRSKPPYYKASYLQNCLYIWTAKFCGQWIMDFLTTFKYEPNKIISVEYSEKPPENHKHHQIEDALPHQESLVDDTEVRLIFMKISSTQVNYNSDEFYKPAVHKIQKLTLVNENFKNILQESNIVYSRNMVHIIARTSMQHTKHLRDLLNSFHSDIFPSLQLNIFDDYVKLSVIGVIFETSLDKLEKVLSICLRKTSITIADWFVAEYKESSIFIYVPRKDADFLKLNPKFLLKGKFIIKFNIVDQNY